MKFKKILKKVLGALTTPYLHLSFLGFFVAFIAAWGLSGYMMHVNISARLDDSGSYILWSGDKVIVKDATKKDVR